MKTQEILLASTVLADVAGVGASLATRAFQTAPVRAEPEARGPAAASAATEPGAAGETVRALNELRMENSALRERLSALEARLGELASTRTPLAEPRQDASVGELQIAELERRIPGFSELAFDDGFVASVSKALDEIEAKEEAEREQRRKEQQAERIERRVAELQTELGLTNRQTSDLRTVLTTADDKRNQLYDDLRENEGDPRDVRESMRTLRDDTLATLQGIFTPEQFEAFRQDEDSDFRRGFGDFGGPGGGRQGEERRDGRGERRGEREERPRR